MLSGVVDTDVYTSTVNFPFVAPAPDGVYMLVKGTPLLQVIPFRRADTELEPSIGVESQRERDARERVHRSTLAEEGWYRRHARAGR